ncbi:HD domain-containing phosphohydrolase [Paenibacillus sp. 1P07SE]
MRQPVSLQHSSAGSPDELPPAQILRIIFDYTAQIANERNLQRVLSLMADMGRRMILSDRCAVWLIDHQKQELFTTVAHGSEEIRVPIGSGFVGHSIATGESLLIEDAAADDRHNADNDQRSHYVTRTVITVPFVGNDGNILGAYQAVNKRSSDAVFTTRDLEYLTLAASYAGKSLESVILHEEIVATQREIILAMGEIGESRSRETGNHVKRVAEYSYLLALGLGLSREQAELLKMASPMHDIGKVAIPDSILHKSGKLTAEEYDQMKEHTVIGYNLLNKSGRRLLRYAARIAYEHHERWDGAGYPRGLRGETIDLFARITAVADVFDALGSERVYKPAWELGRILELMREERGRHFDPRIVDVLLEQLPALLSVRQQYSDC